MNKIFIICISLFLSLNFNISPAQTAFNWEDGGPRYVTYQTITGKTGFITTPSAYCAPMGSLMFGTEFTFTSREPYAGLAAIAKLTFTPVYIFEFGFSKEFAYRDTPSGTSAYFDSTPYLFHYKLRLLDWKAGAIALGQDFDVVPDQSGSPSRGYSSSTVYVVFTGVTNIVGSFNFGFGKTFYYGRANDALFNFYASWVYSFEQLDNRLQILLDFSNADYRAGDDTFKVATEDRAYLNFQLRGVLIKTPKFQWTMFGSLYDLLDVAGNGVGINVNASLGMSFNVDLY